MNRVLFWGIIFPILIFSACSVKEEPLPNVLILYADDLGYGDLSCYGATEIQTPNIDRIAENGIKFLDGYASSATCTPSRYALLTGIYPWKKAKARVLPGNAPLIIDPQMKTLPDLFKEAGYATAVTGKWHLGLGDENLDWNKEIRPGPNELGFDYSYILASTNDRVPTVYVENDQVVGLQESDPISVSYKENFPGEPTGRDNPEMLKLFPSHGHDMSIHNGISRIGFMKGGKSALWKDENMADTILSKSLDFIESNKEKPFFLYYAFHQPHVPRTPHPRFIGLTDLGPRGDVIMEIDYAVGEVLKKLDEFGIAEHTLVIFSSDNGPVLDDGYNDESETRIGNHKPAGNLRGGKYSLFEAGTKVPFMLSWPAKIKPSITNAIICQMDLYASLAQLLEVDIREVDSKNLLEVFLGRSESGREELILEASGKTCLRMGDWVMIPPYEGPPITPWGVNIEWGRSPEYQLYHLKDDPGQQKNLSEIFPKKLEEMKVRYRILTR